MGTKQTHASRVELADSLRQRYQSSSGKTKKLILSEFIASTGYHPKYALHLLNAADTVLPNRGSAPKYPRSIPASISPNPDRSAEVILMPLSTRQIHPFHLTVALST